MINETAKLIKISQTLINREKKHASTDAITMCNNSEADLH